jgi:hypothetical protein
MKKAFTGGSITMKPWSKHVDHMECPGSINTLIDTRLLTNGKLFDDNVQGRIWHRLFADVCICIWGRTPEAVTRGKVGGVSDII